MNINPKTIAYILIAFLIIGLAFLLINWLFNFTGIFFTDKIFSTASPLGFVGIILVLIVGGFYLFKIGFTALKNSF